MESFADEGVGFVEGRRIGGAFVGLREGRQLQSIEGESGKTDGVRLKQPILEVLEEMLKLELAQFRLVPLEDRDAEAENGFNSFGKDEVEDGVDQLEWKAVPAPTASAFAPTSETERTDPKSVRNH